MVPHHRAYAYDTHHCTIRAQWLCSGEGGRGGAPEADEAAQLTNRLGQRLQARATIEAAVCAVVCRAMHAQLAMQTRGVRPSRSTTSSESISEMNQDVNTNQAV